MRRRRLAALLLVLPLAFAVVPAFGAKPAAKKIGNPVIPRTGIYSAEPVKPTADFLLGSFAVVRDQEGTRIVAVETKPGIYYPNVLKCQAAPLPLRQEVVPVSAKGRFKVREARMTEYGKQTVRWSGRWIRPGKVRGTAKIKVKKCKTSFKWKARQLPRGSE